MITIIIGNSQTSMFSCTKKGIPNSLRDAFSCFFVCTG